MIEVYAITVHGRPAGAARSSIRSRTDRARRDEWFTAVRDAVADAMAERDRGTPLSGPVAINAVTYSPRLGSTPTGHKWRTRAPGPLATGETILDALLAAGLIRDRDQVADLRIRRLHTIDERTEPGAALIVHGLDHTEQFPDAGDLAYYRQRYATGGPT